MYFRQYINGSKHCDILYENKDKNLSIYDTKLRKITQQAYQTEPQG